MDALDALLIQYQEGSKTLAACCKQLKTEEDKLQYSTRSFWELVVPGLDDKDFRTIFKEMGSLVCCHSIQNKNGRTPLMVCCTTGNLDEIPMLLSVGADATKVDNTGDTALILACRYVLKHIIGFILNVKCKPEQVGSDGNTALILLAKANEFKNIVRLCSMNCNPSHQNNNCTALSILSQATGQEASEACEALSKLDCNPEVFRKDEKHFSPLQYACSRCDLFRWRQVALNLIPKVSTNHINWRNIHKDTALVWACYKKDEEICRLLIEKGATDTEINYNKLTALLFCLEGKMYKIAQLLIQKKVSILYYKNISFNVCKKVLQSKDKDTIREYLNAAPEAVVNKLTMSEIKSLLNMGDKQIIDRVKGLVGVTYFQYHCANLGLKQEYIDSVTKNGPQFSPGTLVQLCRQGWELETIKYIKSCLTTDEPSQNITGALIWACHHCMDTVAHLLLDSHNINWTIPEEGVSPLLIAHKNRDKIPRVYDRIMQKFDPTYKPTDKKN